MQNNIVEKYAGEAYTLLTKKANEEPSTYAGDGFKAGLVGGAMAKTLQHGYNAYVNKVVPTPRAGLKSLVASGVMWGALGGLGGGMMKRRTNSQEVTTYV